jgi:hypothetical protein
MAYVEIATKLLTAKTRHGRGHTIMRADLPASDQQAAGLFHDDGQASCLSLPGDDL